MAVFLTRLAQNLTLQSDCNLIPSAHGTQQLSSQSNHWTNGLHFTKIFSNQRSIASGEVRWCMMHSFRREDVVAGFPAPGLNTRLSDQKASVLAGTPRMHRCFGKLHFCLH